MQNTTSEYGTQRPAIDGRRPMVSFRFLTALLLSTLTVAACDDPARLESLLEAIPDGASDAEIDAHLMSVDALAAEDGERAAVWSWVPSKTLAGGPICEPDPDVSCGAPPAATWCGVIDALAVQHAIPALYRGILADKCKANQNNACYECWDLANYCSQVGKSCGTLELECRCFGRKMGEI